MKLRLIALAALLLTAGAALLLAQGKKTKNTPAMDNAGHVLLSQWAEYEKMKSADRPQKQAEILLRLNCYDGMAVSFDCCESWETNPDPEAFAAAFTGERADRFFRAVFPEKRAMIDVEPEETWMTVYDPDGALAGTLDALAAAEGLFVWAPPDGEV